MNPIAASYSLFLAEPHTNNDDADEDEPKNTSHGDQHNLPQLEEWLGHVTRPGRVTVAFIGPDAIDACVVSWTWIRPAFVDFCLAIVANIATWTQTGVAVETW